MLVCCDLVALSSSLLASLSLSGRLSCVELGRSSWDNRMDLFNVSAVADARLDKATAGC